MLQGSGIWRLQQLNRLMAHHVACEDLDAGVQLIPAFIRILLAVVCGRTRHPLKAIFVPYDLERGAVISHGSWLHGFVAAQVG